jgi:hypothetical protein
MRVSAVALFSYRKLPHKMCLPNFDAWAYTISGWPGSPFNLYPLGEQRPLPMPNCSLVAEDIKFAFNAWCLLRLGMYFGTQPPRVLSGMHNTTPSMHIALRGNRVFYMHCEVNAELGRSPHTRRVALCARPSAVSLYDPEIAEVLGGPDPVEFVVGMENGMSRAVEERCEYHVVIPQFGSVGSLNMVSATAVVAHRMWSLQTQPQRSVAPSVVASSLPPCDLHGHDSAGAAVSGAKGSFGESRPHAGALLGLTDAAIAAHLASVRRGFPLQLALMLQNDTADRNIGASMRNANVYNADRFVVLNRKKFSRRGTLGTHHYMPPEFYPSIDDVPAEFFEAFELWAINNDFPFFHIDPGSFEAVQYACATGCHGDEGVFPVALPEALALDDEISVVAELQRVIRSGKRGVALVSAEDGKVLPPGVVRRCSRWVYVTARDSVVNNPMQRGLSPQLATAIALERLRVLSFTASAAIASG